MSDTYLKVFIVFYASVCSQGGKDWTLLKGWAHTWHEMPFVTSQRDDFPNVLNSLCSEKNHCEDHRTAHSVMNVSNFIFSISSDLSGSPLYVEAVGGLQHVSRVMERSLPLVTRHLSSQHVLCYGKSKSGTLWRSHSHSETMPFLCFGTKLMHVDSTWRSPPISSSVYNVCEVQADHKTGLGLFRIAFGKSRPLHMPTDVDF